MEKTRKHHEHFPLKWNKAACEELAEGSCDVIIKYWEDNLEAIENRTMGEHLKTGAAYRVTINDRGNKVKKGGLYDPEIHGKVLGHITLHPEDAERTLQAIGAEVNPKNVEEVKRLGNAILAEAKEWPELKAPASPNFMNTQNTMAGQVLLTKEVSDDLYGEVDGERLREMAKKNDTSLYPALAQEFAEDVAALLSNKQDWFRRWLY
jgi:hypothetical protein